MWPLPLTSSLAIKDYCSKKLAEPSVAEAQSRAPPSRSPPVTAQITKKRPFSLHDQLFGDKQFLAESPQGFFWLGEKKRIEYSVIVKRCMKINGAGEWTSTRQGAAGLIQTLRCTRRSSDVFGFMPQVSLTCGLNICKTNLSWFLKTLYDCFCTIPFFFFFFWSF